MVTTIFLDVGHRRSLDSFMGKCGNCDTVEQWISVSQYEECVCVCVHVCNVCIFVGRMRVSLLSYLLPSCLKYLEEF